MCHTNEKNKEIYESIAVIAIYTPNVVEIPFEENREILLDQYREYLLQCSTIMQREKGYRDLIIHNTFICGIFESKIQEEQERIIEAARQISSIPRKINDKAETVLEQLYFGIGVAAGGAVRFSIGNLGIHMAKTVWLGKVLEDARALAQMAFCNGREAVIIADTVSGNIR